MANQSEIFKQASQNSIFQSQQPTAQIVPVTNAQGQDQSQLPINQRDFSSANAIEVPSTPAIPNIQPTYVPGLGVLGADLGGAVKGTMLRQEYGLNSAKNQRANEELGMAKSEIGLKQDFLKIAQADLGIRLNEASQSAQTVEQDLAIRDGMINAAKEGGYTNVIDYLKTADPVKAIQFHAAKLALDKQIMDTDVFKAQMPNKQAQALFDAYAMGGKLAQGIMNAPDDQQEAMYQQSRPLFEALGIKTDSTLTPKMAAAGQLMIAQSTPENIAYAASSFTNYKNVEIGRLNLAKETADKKYGIDSTQSKQIQQQIDGLMAKADAMQKIGAKADLDTINKNIQGVSKIAGMNMSYAKNINVASKNFNDNMNNISTVYNISHFIQEKMAKGEDTNAAQGQLAMAVAAMANHGRPTDADYKAVMAAAGFNEISKNVQGWWTGKRTTLQPWEVKQQVALADYMVGKAYNNQLILEEGWKKNAIQYKTLDPNTGDEINPIDWDNMPLPSKQFAKMTMGQQDNGQPQAQSEQQPAGQSNGQPKILTYDPITGTLK